jgi:AcrR family transcriptional regulator
MDQFDRVAGNPSSATAFPSEDIARLMDRPQHNRRGQVLRSSGQKTRARILVELLRQLSAQPLPEITMASVTKALAVDAAVFYRYFADLGDAMLAAYECVMEDVTALVLLAQAPPSAEPRADALEFVDTFRRFWRRHAPLFKARNALAWSGDARFVACRERTIAPIAEAFANRAAAGEAGRGIGVAQAWVLVTAVEAGIAESFNDGETKLDWTDLRVALADLVAGAVPQG